LLLGGAGQARCASLQDDWRLLQDVRSALNARQHESGEGGLAVQEPRNRVPSRPHLSPTGLFPLFTITLYQKFLSSQDAPVCNYEPSCSHYGQATIRSRGIFLGALMTSDRLQRCIGAARWYYPLDPRTLRALDPVPTKQAHEDSVRFLPSAYP
jgi:putative component of membrane protein insertase Oxa1/YidC/SpoIIIJ protein YidD